ncbi:hypothetical protein Pcinc_007632 [Petrolisthes cinctipes]|uniref:Phosphatidic acid phosphatase type 2/haloperoxidase domain-containing protein n=1 Tax=Petrolisthes cinctipes TaxID=88211 RepID=A0AAE1GAP7_PETCI|nr:hypothetical protein Pcinc_007632 [Petrolisthes cinctipes]
MGQKREVPKPLQQLLAWDVEVTNAFVKFVETKCGPMTNYKGYLKGLEYSCHGIPWFLFTGAFIFYVASPSLLQLLVNIFIALVLDVVVVAVVKAVSRRRRPQGNNTKDMFPTISVDKFSFPSGHATRAVLLTSILCLQYNLWLPMSVLVSAWGGAVCVSRVLLRRHHLLDVLGGVVFGVLEARVMSWLWLSQHAAQYVVGCFLDETQAGASYDV